MPLLSLHSETYGGQHKQFSKGPGPQVGDSLSQNIEWPGQPVLQPRALPASPTTRFLLTAVYFWK